jgi:ferredoxin/flavodoxin---NADP+ reductase
MSNSNIEPNVERSSGHVAILGAGPSGCYVAQALRKADPGVQIAIFDRVPTPYGLVRYGIAPDHQGAKAVTRQFDKVLTQEGVDFVGNVAVGVDISMADLVANFDAVVVATGLSTDRRLDFTGRVDDRVFGAGDLIRLLNSDPGSNLRAGGQLASLGTEIAILGTGNVAVDVARLLVKTSEGLRGSDVDDHSRDALVPEPVKKVYILGRCEPELAKWDQSMLKELASVDGILLTIDGVPLLTREEHETTTTVIDVRFRRTPVAATERAGRVRLSVRHAFGEKTEVLEVDSVITALGFIAADGGMPDAAEASNDRIFKAGGVATGRLGNLAENRKHAIELTSSILARLRSEPAGARNGLDGLVGLQALNPVSFDGWKRIDAAEVERARPDRCRTKFTTHHELLTAAGVAGNQAMAMTTATRSQEHRND